MMRAGRDSEDMDPKLKRKRPETIFEVPLNQMGDLEEEKQEI